MKSQSNKLNVVWGGLLILVGIVALVEAYTDLSAWVWVAILVVAGFGAFAVYLSNRTQAGLLIPPYILWVIAGLVAFVTLDVLRDEFIATYVLWVIAFPFLVGFLRNRENWGLLIPAYVLLAVGLMVGLIGMRVLDDLLIPAYVMFAIAIPFLVVYARNPKNWWGLIPGGILSLIGLSFLIAEAAVEYLVPALLILAGIWILVRQYTRKEPEELEGPEGPSQDSGGLMPQG